MKKLLRYYTALKGEDLTACRKFIASPIHHKEGGRLFSVLPLFDKLGNIIGRISYAEKNGEKKEKDFDKILFNISYPKLSAENKYDKKQFSRLKSELVDLIEDFLTYQMAQEDNFQQKNYRFAALHKYKLNQDFVALYETMKIDDEVENTAKYSYAAEKEELYLRYYVDKNNKYPKDENLNKASIAFSYATLIENLRLACISFGTEGEGNHLLDLQNTLIDYVRNMPKQQRNILLEIYLSCYEMQKDVMNSHTHYDNLKKLIKENVLLMRKEKPVLSLLSPLEMYDIEEIIGNFCTRYINNNAKVYAKDLIEWYHDGIKFEFLTQSGFILHRTFRRIVFNYIALGQFDEAIIFIAENKHRLEKTYQEEFINFLKAHVHFANNNYEEARKVLNLKTPDAYNEKATSLGLYVFGSVIFIEETNTESFEYTSNNFQRFLNRNKEEVKPMPNYKNLILHSRKIRNLYINPNTTKDDILLVQKDIQDEVVLASKANLLRIVGYLLVP